jgi:magnesium transporter
VAMLSDLARRPVVDGTGRRGVLVDLAVDLTVNDRPPVVLLVVHERKSSLIVQREQVVEFGDPIRVTDFGEATPCTEELLANHDLLRRDVLDMLVLDLDHELATRVNDISLEPEADGSGLVVVGIDTSPQAILRRITRGLLGGGEPQHLVAWSDIELLHGDPRRADDRGAVQPRVTRLLPARIADLAEALPYLHAAELLGRLDVALAADVFEFLQPERQIQVLDELDGERAVAILAEVDPDDAADVLGRLPLERAREILERLPRRHALLVADLLRYPPGATGGIMTNDVVVVRAELTVREAIDAIRPRLASPDLAYYVYVVSDLESRKLVGIVTLRDLLLATLEQKIADIMNDALVTARPLEPATIVAYRLTDHQLNALPVVDDEQRLLGVVTIDKAVAQIAPDGLRQDLPRVFA